VHRIGEVDRRGAARQGIEVALGGEDEDLILVHLELGVLEKLLGIRGMLQDVEEFAQPAILAALVLALPLLVAPMGGHTEFGDLMHFPGADLDFDPLLFRSNDAGMERAITIRLGG